MARIPRQNLLSLYFHVIVHGLNKEYIFSTREMKEKYKNLLKENIQQSNLKLLSYCIMSNHAHMLMYVEDIQEMSKIMQKINTSFAKFYNGRKNRVGFVFRDRFFTQQILSRQQLYNCLVYIHNNPVKAGIVRTPKDYEYSSYNEWINKEEVIDEMSAKLIYEEEKYNMGEFKKMHFNNEILDIDDIIETVDYNEILAKHEKINESIIQDIIKKEEILEEVVMELKQYSNLSIRQISNILKLNRPKITKIIKKIEEKQILNHRE